MDPDVQALLARVSRMRPGEGGRDLLATCARRGEHALGLLAVLVLGAPQRRVRDATPDGVGALVARVRARLDLEPDVVLEAAQRVVGALRSREGNDFGALADLFALEGVPRSEGELVAVLRREVERMVAERLGLARPEHAARPAGAASGAWQDLRLGASDELALGLAREPGYGDVPPVPKPDPQPLPLEGRPTGEPRRADGGTAPQQRGVRLHRKSKRFEVDDVTHDLRNWGPRWAELLALAEARKRASGPKGGGVKLTEDQRRRLGQALRNLTPGLDVRLLERLVHGRYRFREVPEVVD